MFAFGKRLSRVKCDIVAYDILIHNKKWDNLLGRYIDVYINLDGNIVTPSCAYRCQTHKVLSNRSKADKGLYTYKYGFKVFSKRPELPKGNFVIVPVIIPKESYYSYNLFGQILSTEVIYPNKF